MDDRGFILESDATAPDIYSKLQDGEIRTLLLQPGSKNSSVICEMQVMPQATTSQYEALSYVWGEMNKSKTLSCNGFDFAVTKSLHSALMNLRYTDSWRRIWVDQLCINQDESREVMTQVAEMGKIYSNASRVIVWLGNYDRKMAQAWLLLQETHLGSSLARSDLLQTSPSASPRTRPGNSRKFSSSSSISSKSSRSPRLTSSSRESLSSCLSSSPPRSQDRRSSGSSSPALKRCLAIFQHVWFTRKWTFQEVILAKAAIICCGDVEMAWSDLTAWYFHYASKVRSSSILYDSDGAFEHIMNVRSELDKDTLKLSTLLMMTRQRLSTKPEDAIYALLGLIPNLSTYIKYVNHQDEIASGRPACLDIFLAAFKYCLDNEPDLSILSAAGIYKCNSNHTVWWPSWLPDWRQQIPLRPLVLLADQTGSNEYHAAGSSAPEFSLSISSPKQHEKKRHRQRQRQNQQQQNSHKPTIQIKGHRIGILTTRSGSWPNAYFIPGRAAAHCMASSVTPSSFSLPISSLPLSLSPSLISSSPSSSNTTTTTRPNKPPETNVQLKPDPYARHILSTATQRAQRCEPARTSAAVQQGDWVCLLRGGPVLYVIRPFHDNNDYNGNGNNNDFEYDHDYDRNEKKNTARKDPFPGARGRNISSSSSSSSSRQQQQERQKRQTGQRLIPTTQETRPQRCRFIGECAVNGLMDGSLFEYLTLKRNRNLDRPVGSDADGDAERDEYGDAERDEYEDAVVFELV